MGAKLKSKTHLINTFFARLASKFKKVLIWPKKISFLIKKVSKNAEFHADFESVEKVVKKCIFSKLFKIIFVLFPNFDCKCAGNVS